MTAHIANGMYGAVVIAPADLPRVDRTYVLIQGEYYLGDHDGGEVDAVWKEGVCLLDASETTGSQALELMPAQGGFTELVFPEPGNYPFVSHFMIDAERGAHGIFAVTAAQH